MLRTLPILISGNGIQTLMPHPLTEATFRFNSASSPTDMPGVIDASMASNLQTGQHSISLRTDSTQLAAWANEMQAKINSLIAKQQRDLGCLPSTGFCVVHGLWEACDSVWVDGILFDPSLSRLPTMLPRKPLRQAFHNWLGERRLTFSRWLDSPREGWTWPLVNGRIPSDTNTSTHNGIMNHIEVLDALLNAQVSRSRVRLKEISSFSIAPSPDLLVPSQHTVRLESCFHLERGRSETSNWWLFDNEMSRSIDRLASSLRMAQYMSFMVASQASERAEKTTSL